MLTGSQIRAARGLLGWTSERLAEASGVHYASISRAEQHDGPPPVRASTLVAVKAALETGGVVFIEDGVNRPGGVGVRMRENVT
ncbi:MAG: helix-turn-helix domain-containing protein [Thalassobaculum sp.]|uniref:helix-turn-helix domain-containing protein n=1 Tax=Thalassobaculum sp. TaxID=2022740 RepID=UPI0032ED7A18